MSQPEDQPSEALRFATEPYRPARCSNATGMMLLSAATLAGAVVIGVLVGIVSQWFNVVVLFPLGVGLLVGLCGYFGIRAGRIADPMLAGIVAFVGGCVAMLSMHYCQYYLFLDAADKEAPGFRDDWHQDGRGFVDFMEIRAVKGVTIARSRRGGEGLNLGYTGSYIYWAAEFLLAAGLAGWGLHRYASEPFCAQCQSWKKCRVLGRVGDPAMTAADAIAAGELTRLAEQNFDSPIGRLQIRLAVCPQCGANAPIDVQVQEAGTDKKGNETLTEVAHVTYPGEALPVFEALARPHRLPPTRNPRG